MESTFSFNCLTPAEISSPPRPPQGNKLSARVRNLPKKRAQIGCCGNWEFHNVLPCVPDNFWFIKSWWYWSSPMFIRKHRYKLEPGSPLRKMIYYVHGWDSDCGKVWQSLANSGPGSRLRKMIYNVHGWDSNCGEMWQSQWAGSDQRSGNTS